MPTRHSRGPRGRERCSGDRSSARSRVLNENPATLRDRGKAAEHPRCDGHAECCDHDDAVVSNGVSNRPEIRDGYAKSSRNHNPRVGGSSPSSGTSPHAGVQRRSRCDGRCHRAAPADDRLARNSRHAARCGHDRLDPVGHEGQRDPRRRAAEAQRPHVRRGRPRSRARRDRADRECRGRRRRRPATAADHDHRALPATEQRPSGDRASRGGTARTPRRRARPRARDALPGQRGLRLVWHRVGRAVGVLVRGRDRPDLYARAQQAGRIAEDIPTNHNPASPP